MSLASWMLEHGNPGAREFLEHEITDRPVPVAAEASIYRSTVTNLRHRASIFSDTTFSNRTPKTAGIFIFESAALVSGIEVYGVLLMFLSI